jgi:hypothetical protein
MLGQVGMMFPNPVTLDPQRLQGEIAPTFPPALIVIKKVPSMSAFTLLKRGLC